EVVERDAEVEVGVVVLLVRQLDVEADREPAALLRAAVRGLHHPGAASRDDRESSLGEPARDVTRLPVGGIVLAHAGGAEDRDGRPADPLDRGEALAKL